MEDKRIVVAFDIHETIIEGLIGLINKMYKGKSKFVRKLSHLACDSSILVGVYTYFSFKNENICKKMKELYRQSDIFKVVLLTDSYKSSYKILSFMLKIKGIYYFEELLCRDYISESTVDYKKRKILEYDILFLYDDNVEMREVMAETDCHVIGVVD